jgi:hypothetical protein
MLGLVRFNASMKRRKITDSDPIRAARGALKGKIKSTEELRAQARKDEAAAEARRR